MIPIASTLIDLVMDRSKVPAVNLIRYSSLKDISMKCLLSNIYLMKGFLFISEKGNGFAVAVLPRPINFRQALSLRELHLLFFLFFIK